MPWFNFTDEELKLTTWALDVLADEASHDGARDFKQRLEAGTKPGEFDEAFAEAANQQISDPDEIEGWPYTSFVSASDEGAYVMAWIWVDNSDAGLPETYLIELTEAGEVIHAELFRAESAGEASKRLSEYWNETPQAVLNGERFKAELFSRDDDHWFSEETISGADDDDEAEDENADYPLEDWQHEVAAGDTKRGYHDWVEAQKEMK